MVDAFMELQNEFKYIAASYTDNDDVMAEKASYMEKAIAEIIPFG